MRDVIAKMHTPQTVACTHHARKMYILCKHAVLPEQRMAGEGIIVHMQQPITSCIQHACMHVYYDVFVISQSQQCRYMLKMMDPYLFAAL